MNLDGEKNRWIIWTLGYVCDLLGAISLFTTWLHGHNTQQVDPELAGVITYPT